MTDPPWILDDLPVGVWVGNVPDGTLAYSNKMFERILGRPPAKLGVEAALQMHDLFDREGRVYSSERLPFGRVVASRACAVVDDIVIRRASGDTNIRAFGSPVFAADGALTHVIVAFLDITKEVAADAERKLVNERLQFVCNHAPIAIWMTDVDGKLTLSEGAGLASLGVKPGALVGKNVLDVYAGHPTIPGYIRRGLAGESFWYTVEVGEAVYETWVSPLRDASGKMVAMAALSNDVSQLRKLQRTAIQNDRVMAMGTLAASVAHEINNPLTYVLSHGDAMGEELDSLERLLSSGDAAKLEDARASLARLREQLAPIRTGTSRIAAITRDLRSFSRPDERSLAPVNLRVVVESVLQLVAKEVEARARLVLDLQDTAPVIGNEARLIQVVLNLIVNAYQALPHDSAAYHKVGVSTRNDDARVIIEVSDSGPGVPAADRERIFEPFFSTKAIGIGTGLGLFVCRNIVRGFAGEVEVADRPGGGAVFRVVLPAAAALGRAPAPAPAVPARKAAGAHVVLIEDDRLVARAFSMQLAQAGYRVTTFADGQSGLRGLIELDDVDLVFCDLMMTGMTGMDVAEQLAKQSPDKAAKLVLMTGGAFSARARDFVANHRDHTVDKPFDIVAEASRRLAPR